MELECQIEFIDSSLERSKKEEAVKTKAQVIEIDVERIRPNLRLIYHREIIEELCQEMRSRGQLEPIQVWFDGECFRIWDGEKRWRVCKMLGMTRVKALLIEFEEIG
jgi:ParB family chromosome partitioning protein